MITNNDSNNVRVYRTKEIFEHIVYDHLNSLFYVSLMGKGLGQIEFRTLNPQSRTYFKSAVKAFNKAYDTIFEDARKDLYYGVNPRSSKTGTIKDIKFLSAFHAVVPYDSPDNERQTNYKTPEDAIEAIDHFKLPPRYWIRTPEEIQCFWTNTIPLQVNNFGHQCFTDVNAALAHELKGDQNVCSIDECLRMLYFRDKYEEGYSEILFKENCVDYSHIDLLRLIA